MAYWKSMRAPQLSLGGFQGTGTKFLQVVIVLKREHHVGRLSCPPSNSPTHQTPVVSHHCVHAQAQAENIPEPDNSYDIVFSVYLFHELPPDVRRQVAAEMARCCKPGLWLLCFGCSVTVVALIGCFTDFTAACCCTDFTAACCCTNFTAACVPPQRTHALLITHQHTSRWPRRVYGQRADG